MDLEQKARLDYHLATRLEECPFEWYWAVSIDNGFNVFQTEDDQSLKEPNSWMRLKQFCQDEKVKIIAMVYGCRSNSRANLNITPNADGYFFAKRVRRMLMATDPNFWGYEDQATGFGALNKNTLHIMWRDPKGQLLHESRDIGQNQPITLITV
jgi:hypothetical protein